MLYTPAMLSEWLHSDIVYESLSPNYPQCDGGIVLLNDHFTRLESAYLYIGECAAVVEALTRKHTPGEPLIVLSAGCTEEMKALPLDPAVTLIATGLDLLGLYNRAHWHVHKFLAWDADLRQALYNNAGLQALLDCAFAGLQDTLLLMNAGYKLLAACYAEDINDPLSLELRDNGYLSFETVKFISHDIAENQRPTDGANDHTEYLATQSGLYSMVWPILYKGDVAGRLVVVLHNDRPNACRTDTCRILTYYIQEYMTSGHVSDYSSNAAFGSLVSDLIECRLTDEAELAERLKQTSLAIKKYYHVLLVSFPAATATFRAFVSDTPGGSQVYRPGAIPWNYIISQLEQVFPFSNSTVYQDSILMLVRKSTISPHLHFDREAVERILNYHDGYMAVGNFSKFLTSLPSIYKQTNSTIRLGMKMRTDPHQRIFYYEEFSMYQTIELAASGLRTMQNSSNLVYLCHPALISLVRYDRKHNTNLREVLFIYLTNERNAAEAARLLYIHRNTMLYKISRIEEILGEKLDDPMLRARLLYSYYVIEYASRYLGEDILRLKRNLPAEDEGKAKM